MSKILYYGYAYVDFSCPQKVPDWSEEPLKSGLMNIATLVILCVSDKELDKEQLSSDRVQRPLQASRTYSTWIITWIWKVRIPDRFRKYSERSYLFIAATKIGFCEFWAHEVKLCVNFICKIFVVQRLHVLLYTTVYEYGALQKMTPFRVCTAVT